jgi:hypothetical protein
MALLCQFDAIASQSTSSRLARRQGGAGSGQAPVLDPIAAVAGAAALQLNWCSWRCRRYALPNAGRNPLGKSIFCANLFA